MLFLQPIMAEAQTNLPLHSPTREREREGDARTRAMHCTARTGAAENDGGEQHNRPRAGAAVSRCRIVVVVVVCADYSSVPLHALTVMHAAARAPCMHACMVWSVPRIYSSLRSTACAWTPAVQR